MNRSIVTKELRRELATRKRVYPDWVQSGKLTQATADHRVACIESAIAELDQEMVAIPKELLSDLKNVCTWLQGFYADLASGTTLENHPDPNAVEYLVAEANTIRCRVTAYEPDQDPQGVLF